MKKITLLLFVALTVLLNVANAQTTLYSENFSSNLAWTGDREQTFTPSTLNGTWAGGVNLTTAGDLTNSLRMRYGWNTTKLSLKTTDVAVTIPNINVAGNTGLTLSINLVIPGDATVPFIEASVDGGTSWVTLTTVAGGSWGEQTQSIVLPAATSTISLRINPPAAGNDQCFDNFIITGTAGATGINQLSDNSIQVYPNPATNYILAKNAQRVTILDLNGRIVKEAFNSEKVDVSSLANGAYIVKVKTNGITKIGKLIKQ